MKNKCQEATQRIYMLVKIARQEDANQESEREEDSNQESSRRKQAQKRRRKAPDKKRNNTIYEISEDHGNVVHAIKKTGIMPAP